MQVPFVDLKAQHRPILDEITAAVGQVLTNTDFVLGKAVNQFEEEFAAFCGVPYAVGVDSGLSALQLLLMAYEIGPGDEVIVPANSFVASAAAVTFAGALPVLVDVDPVTYTIDPAKAEAAISPRTKAIIPVHLYGMPADMDAILALAKRHNLVVIEDAAQAHGARYKGTRIGALGHGAAFSFYPAKNLGACGEAGIAVTHDLNVANRLRALRNCGQVEKYHHVYAPYNHRIDTIQAAILRVKLPHIDAWNEARQQHAARYNELLSGSDVVTPVFRDGFESVWHLYVIRVADRARMQAHLSARNIGTGVHYPIPIHLQEYYRDLGYQRGDMPVTEAQADQILSLPMFAELTDDAIDYVVEAIREFPRELATPVEANRIDIR